MMETFIKYPEGLFYVKGLILVMRDTVVFHVSFCLGNEGNKVWDPKIITVNSRTSGSTVTQLDLNVADFTEKGTHDDYLIQK